MHAAGDHLCDVRSINTTDCDHRTIDRLDDLPQRLKPHSRRRRRLGKRSEDRADAEVVDTGQGSRSRLLQRVGGNTDPARLAHQLACELWRHVIRAEVDPGGARSSGNDRR